MGKSSGNTVARRSSLYVGEMTSIPSRRSCRACPAQSMTSRTIGWPGLPTLLDRTTRRTTARVVLSCSRSQTASFPTARILAGRTRVVGSAYVRGVPTLDELERLLRERLDALGPAPRVELLHVLMLPDFERVLPSRRPPRGEKVTYRPNAANCAWFSANDVGRKANVPSRRIRRSFRHTRRGAKEDRARDHQ